MSGKAASQGPAVDGDSFGRLVKLGISVGGIYTCYLAYGIFQEELYTVQPDGTKFSATAFVLLVQCLANGLIALIGDFLDLFVFKSKATENGSFRWLHVLPTYAVLSTSVVYVLAMYTSNEALGFVSYPTQALVKSCKMIPVMLGSIIISGTSYKLLKYVCVLLMTIGITMFQFGSKAKKGHDSADSDSEWIGMVLLTASLVLDGITGPLQQRLKALKLTNFEQILVNNTWASLLMLFIAVGLGQLDSSLVYLSTHPKLIGALALFALTSAFGQIFIFWTIRTFDALTLSTVTTTRKFFTILMSVFFYGHALTPQQWLAVGVVGAGMGLEVIASKDDKAKHKEKVHHPAPHPAGAVELHSKRDC